MPAQPPAAAARWLLAAVALSVLLSLSSVGAVSASVPIVDTLQAREAAIADRVAEVAAATDMPRLIEGMNPPARRRAVTRTLMKLRATDGQLVRNACLASTTTRDRTLFEGGLGDPRASACISSGLRDAAAASTGVLRDIATGESPARLWMAGAVRDGDDVIGVLSVDVDLRALLEQMVVGRNDVKGVAVVDLESDEVLASHTRSPDGAAGRISQEQAEAAMATVRSGVETLSAGVAGSQAGAGEVAMLAPLWRLADGRRLGLLVLPFSAAGAGGSGLEPVIVALGLLAIVAFLGAVGLGVRRAMRKTEARARVETLYQDISSGPGIDGLTGVGNQKAYGEALANRVTTYLETGAQFALAVLDIDDLAAVNDYEGQVAGDEVLTGVAETLDQLTRPEDAIFRVGGDEFAVLMPGLDAGAAAVTMERALHVFRRPPSGIRPGSFSGGVSAVPQCSTDRDIVERQARTALAWVKAHGRGAVEVYDSERDQVLDQPHAVAMHAVREVVTGKLLSPVFQPIVDLRSGRILGFEGLVRPDPRGPLPSTSHLFAAASASGRTVELDLACLDVVLAGARDIGSDRLITLNLSPRTLEVKHFDASWLLDGLLRNGIAPGRVIIELTERDAIGDMRKLQRTFTALQKFGLRLAADDVGAGNSGLRLLSQVRFDIVKIDLTLVQDGVQQLHSRAVLESLRDLAVHQEAKIVAEGVETPEQLQVLRDLDIAAAQGFLLGRPERSVAATFVDLRQLVPAGATTLQDATAHRAPSPMRLTAQPAAATAPVGTGWGLSRAGAARRR